MKLKPCLVLYLLIAVSCVFLPAASLRAEIGEFFEEEEIYDPFESMNRQTFQFNDGFDVYLLEPVARGYKYIFPQFMRTGFGNVFDNLRYPAFLVSDLIQFKFGQALDHTGRFLINSTVGIGGLIDVAEDMGIERHVEGFGVALAYHGVPAGPYLMIPFMGPTTLRDGIGLAVDLALNPIFWIGSFPGVSSSTATKVSYGVAAVEVVHIRSGLLEAVKAGKESSLDYYLFLQSTYYQYRSNLLWDGKPPGGDIFDDELEFEDLELENPDDL